MRDQERKDPEEEEEHGRWGVGGGGGRGQERRHKMYLVVKGKEIPHIVGRAFSSLRLPHPYSAAIWRCATAC